MSTETIDLSALPFEELKSSLEARLRERRRRGELPNAPEGFTLTLNDIDIQDFQMDPDYDGGLWDGPTHRGDGWVIQTDWSADSGIRLTVLETGSNEGAGFTPAQAAELAQVLGEVASMYV